MYTPRFQGKNNRKRTACRNFHMMPVKGGKGPSGRKRPQTVRVFPCDDLLAELPKSTYVGIADFGAMRRGYHLNRKPNA